MRTPQRVAPGLAHDVGEPGSPAAVVGVDLLAIKGCSNREITKEQVPQQCLDGGDGDGDFCSGEGVGDGGGSRSGDGGRGEGFGGGFGFGDDGGCTSEGAG